MASDRPPPLLARPALDERLDARVSRRLAPLLWALSAAFAFFAAITLLFRPPGATVVLTAIDASGALVLAAAALAAPRFPSRHANKAAAAALLFAAGASLVAIKLLQLPAQTTNLMIVQLVGSVILLSPRWTALLIVACFAGWSVIAWSEGAGEAWLNAGFSLVVTSIMSAMIQLTRVRDARATEELAAQSEDRARRLERAVRTEREHARALASANDSLEAFSYVIAHDLKEPLRSTRVYLEEAMTAPDPAEREDMLRRAAKSQEHLEHLVRGLLDWSRATTAPLETQRVEVRELLDEGTTRQIFERALAERRARLLVDATLPAVVGTPALIRQVLGNLILNAIRHADVPDAQVRIFAAHDAPRGMVDIVVQDNGPGFSEAFLEQDRHSGGSPQSIKGGFGIAIARRAAGRLGGEVHLGNRRDGRGAEVHVLLPAPDAEATRREALAQRVRELV